MRDRLLLLNRCLLFLCASMYLGTGWSMWLFSFPIIPQLTVDNYYLQFVPQVTEATRFFTGMTLVMMASAAVMIWDERRAGRAWIPVVVLLSIVAATGLTMVFILPYNREMAAHVTNPARLREVLDRWASLNRVRVSLWTVQWIAMMYSFGRPSSRTREAQ